MYYSSIHPRSWVELLRIGTLPTRSEVGFYWQMCKITITITYTRMRILAPKSERTTNDVLGSRNAKKKRKLFTICTFCAQVTWFRGGVSVFVLDESGFPS